MSRTDAQPPTPVWLWIMPLAVAGVTLLAIWAPDGLGSVLFDLLPFLITLWIGMGFTFAWDMLHYRMHLEGASRGVAAATGVLCAVILLTMIGGIRTLWEDPWLFGVAVVPGLRLIAPWLEARLGHHVSPDDGSS